MSWRDRKFERRDESFYPFIQWVNDGATLEPRSPIGGFAQPIEQAQILGVSIPGEMRVIHHRGGDKTDAVFATELQFAVLATRFAWLKDGQRVATYQSGARGKLQCLGVARDMNGNATPLTILTFSGLVGEQFATALRAHKMAVRVATGNSAPSYAFYGLYSSGEVQAVGASQQSNITTIDYHKDFDPDQAYIGDAVLDALDWSEIDRWAAEWEGEEMPPEMLPMHGGHTWDDNSNGDELVDTAIGLNSNVQDGEVAQDFRTPKGVRLGDMPDDDLDALISSVRGRKRSIKVAGTDYTMGQLLDTALEVKAQRLGIEVQGNIVIPPMHAQALIPDLAENIYAIQNTLKYAKLTPSDPEDVWVEWWRRYREARNAGGSTLDAAAIANAWLDSNAR